MWGRCVCQWAAQDWLLAGLEGHQMTFTFPDDCHNEGCTLRIIPAWMARQSLEDFLTSQ